MADAPSEPFDLDRLQQLVEMMEQHDLREVKLQRGSERWVVRRGAPDMPAFAHAPPPAFMPPPAPTSAATGAPVGVAAASGFKEIKSPMVGTFYRSPSPGEPVFVKEGDRVANDTTVCLIEAMKFFNQIKAECTGTIVKALVNDGDPVDFGQVLVHVKPE